MAQIGTIARPYAQAAFGVAQSEANLAGWAEFLEKCAQLSVNGQMHQLASNPKIAKSQILSLFEEVVKPVNDTQKNFLHAVVSQNRVEALPAVYETFVAHKNAHEGSADVHIVSAFPMSDAQAADLLVSLEKKLGKKLKPELSVDASLLGGFCVTVGDEVLDMSVRAKLARMQSALTV